MWNCGPWSAFQWMWLFPLIGLIVMVLMVSFMFGRGRLSPLCRRWNTHEGDTRDQKSQSALDILKQRYAKGEISKDEFERVKRDVE